MAKRIAQRGTPAGALAAADQGDGSFTVDMAGGELKKEINSLRPSVKQATQEWSRFKETATDAGKRLLPLFSRLLAAATEKGLTFTRADFARIFDPSVPFHAKAKEEGGEPGYQQNPTYQAIDWIWRSMGNKKRAPGQQGKRDPVADQVARILSTFVPVLFKDENYFWSAFAKVFGMERGIENLKKRVHAAPPIIDLHNVIHKPLITEARQATHLGEVVPMRETVKMTGAQRETANLLKQAERKLAPMPQLERAADAVGLARKGQRVKFPEQARREAGTDAVRQRKAG